jgi:formylmethanofuran:tetrahydromethanopterin formyltransferase
MTRNAFTVFLQNYGSRWNFVGGSEKFNIALGKAKFIVGQNLGFDINIMGCEFYRMGVESQMSSMPILDTCTEVTASLLKLPGVVVNLNCLR